MRPPAPFFLPSFLVMKLSSLLGLFSLTGGLPQAGAAPFSAGNLLIYRVGTGTGSLLTAATPVFLDEYSPANCCSNDRRTS